MNTDQIETSHDNTDDVEVEESGSLLETDVVETEDQETTPFELPEAYRDNPKFAGIDSAEALFEKIASSGAPEAYEYPEGYDEAVTAAISERAAAADMSQAQLDAMLTFQAEQAKESEKAMWSEVHKGVEALKGEWGAEFEKNVAGANKAIRAFDKDGSIRKLMKANPTIANHPDVVKMFKAIHAAIDVDRFLDSEGNPKSRNVDEAGRPILSTYDKSMR